MANVTNRGRVRTGDTGVRGKGVGNKASPQDMRTRAINPINTINQRGQTPKQVARTKRGK